MFLGLAIFILIAGGWEAWGSSWDPAKHLWYPGFISVVFLPLSTPAHGTVDVDRKNLLHDCIQASGDPALV